MLNLQQYLCNLFRGCPAGVLFCVSAGSQLLLMSSNGGKGGLSGREGCWRKQGVADEEEWQTDGRFRL